MDTTMTSSRPEEEEQDHLVSLNNQHNPTTTDASSSSSTTPAVVEASSASSSSSYKSSSSTSHALISPTGVTELENDDSVTGTIRTTCSLLAESSTTTAETTTPVLSLHPDLRRDLSQALVNRVSFYGIIHDINKEMMAMLANDCCAASIGDKEDATSPLVLAATQTQPRNSSMEQLHEEALKAALIDEEEWLLSTIASREPAERQEQLRACPETFLQAMGEKEYENPVASLAGNTRTQLWKPSRSWWEAKSGKNPWIEPTSHNKRWR